MTGSRKWADFYDRKKDRISNFFACFALLTVCAITIWLFDSRSAPELFLRKRNLLIIGTFVPLSWLFAEINSRIHLSELIFRYRYCIAGALLILCVIFEISGSSIGMWASYLGVSDDGILLGESRAIRTDEWAVNIPMIKSQYYVPSGSFPYINDIVRAAPTDMFSVAVIAPVWNILVLFRPFYWGFLVLPFSNGLAFFWCARMISLFMASFEFGRMITNDNRFLAILYAVMLLLAPAIQWWSGGIVEMVIAFELATILLKKYMKTDSYIKRCFYALVIVWSAGLFIFQLYPAWQVPLFYILLAVAAWIFVTKWKNFRKTYKDLLIALAGLALTGTFVAYFYITSKDAIQAVMETVYPGSRSESGGGLYWGSLFNYITNIWYSVVGDSNYANPCEAAQFLHFFPLSFILPIAAMVRQKKKDLLSILLLAVNAFLFIYVFFGFPEFLAKISFLYMAPSGRAVVLWQMSGVLLMTRGLYLWSAVEKKKTLLHAAVNYFVIIMLAVAFAGITVWFARSIAPNYLSRGMLVCSFLALFVIAFFVLLHTYREVLKPAVWSVLLLCVFTGLLINPIRSGISFFEASDTVSAMHEIEEKDSDAVWIVDNMGLPNINMGLLEGLNTINSTNSYPDLERWHLLDPEGENEYIYNRYAHIVLELSDEDRFELCSPDCFKVYLSKEGVRKLRVDYILTNRELTDYELVRETSVAKIYRVKQ